MKKNFRTVFAVFGLIAGLLCSVSGAELPGKLVITGDNVPFFGNYYLCGFTNMIKKTCQAASIPMEIVSLARGGSKSDRIVEDLEKNLSAWVRDDAVLLVWFGQVETLEKYGTDLADTRKNLAKIRTLAGKSKVRIVLFSMPAFYLDLPEGQQKKLIQFNELLKKSAMGNQFEFLDMAEIFDRKATELAAKTPDFRMFQNKAFELNPLGDFVASSAILSYLGMEGEVLDATLAEREKLYSYSTSIDLTAKQFAELSELSFKKNMTVQAYIRSVIMEDLGRK